MKILIADDDRVWVELLGGALRKRGIEVVTAFDGMQCMMAAMKTLPDAIVLDVQMPGGTGLDALKRLKMSTKTAMIPVVVVSGAQDAAMPVTVRQLGAHSFVRKPTTPDDVVGVLGGFVALP